MSFSNAFEFTNLAEVKELRASSYGNSLIETISLTLENSGSVGDIQKLLNDLLFNLNKDQEAADKQWEATNKTLTLKIETLTHEIEELQKQISVDRAELKEYEAKRDQALKNLVQYKKQVEENNKALQANDQNRKKDEEEYKKSVQEHNDVINAIEAVIKELGKLKGSVSGKGKPAHVEEIAAEKRDKEFEANHANHANLKKSFVQLTRDEEEAMIFLELATSADQAALLKLIELLDQLSESTKKSLNDDEEHEKKSIETHKQLMETLQGDNKRLESNISEQEQNLKKYQGEITRLEKKIDEEVKLLESKEAEKAATIKERADKETQWKTDKEERHHEGEIIRKLEKIVQERLANMSKFLSSKLQ